MIKPALTLHLTPQARQGKALPSDLLARQIQLLIQNGSNWSEIPPVLRGCVWLSRYAADVANGGHAQFIANAIATLGDTGASTALDWVIDGARQVGADDLADLAQEALDWVTAHPEDAQDQTGASGGRAPALDPLDTRYLKLDRGDTDAFDAALAPADPTIAENLRHALGIGAPTMPYTPMHSVAMQLALLRHEPVQIVPRGDFDAVVLAQVAQSDAARLAPLKRARVDVLFHLPGPWFSAALLATMHSLPDGTWVEIWGDDKLSKARPHVGGKGLLRLIGAEARDITVSQGTVTVLQAPPPLQQPAVPAPKAKGFFTRRKQQKQQAIFDARLAAENAARARAPTETAPLSAGKALHKAWSDMYLAEALTRFTQDQGLPAPTALRLISVAQGDTPKIDWMFKFGHGATDPTAHVIQKPEAVLVRLQDAPELSRYLVSDLRALAEQLG